jgi:hypothetical protein
MLSLNTRFTTVSPAQYQRINQISLLVLVTTAALAPAWLNIVAVAGYSIMNFLGFKKLVMAIIDRVLGDIPGLPARQTPIDRYPDIRRSTRPRSGNSHKYYGAGDISRRARHGKRIDRQFKKG